MPSEDGQALANRTAAGQPDFDDPPAFARNTSRAAGAALFAPTFGARNYIYAIQFKYLTYLTYVPLSLS